MSSTRKLNDVRRFGYCIRCLQLATAGRDLKEHHIYGRKSRPSEVVFICQDCHSSVENSKGPILEESEILKRKNALLVSSSSLRYVIDHRKEIVMGFDHLNRNGPSMTFGPGGSFLTGDLGAIGQSGKKYYFVSVEDLDAYVLCDCGWNQDGIGGPMNNKGWVRFLGDAGDNILNSFISLHSSQGSPGEVLEALKQNDV